MLRALEGWYDLRVYGSVTVRKYKFSCRFHDIQRCSTFNLKDEHFYSCYAEDRFNWHQPVLRCRYPNWAILYTPDKHGNFMGRAFFEFSWAHHGFFWFPWPTLTRYAWYGNKQPSDKAIKKALRARVWWMRFIWYRVGPTDKTLRRKS